MLNFPCKYLGLPISVNKLAKTQVQSIIERLVDQLPGWKSDLTNHAGRTVMVWFVMTSTQIYLAMAMERPPWALNAMDKFRRGFMWRERREAQGGHCLLAWPKVTRPLELGGLGIHDLKSLCWALRMRWLWLGKMKPDKPWAAFPIQVRDNIKAFFCHSHGDYNRRWEQHTILDRQWVARLIYCYYYPQCPCARL